MNSANSLKWRFDVSTFRLIGRDLITDRITALFELIKNCYDANATSVTVSFEDFDNSYRPSTILIEDNGIGMSFEDIRDKWMVIGTSNKRKQKVTPYPMYRRCVGEKGIGRFAVDKLGDKVTIFTKKKDCENILKVVIDWSEYFSTDQTADLTLFTDIENAYYITPAQNIDDHGTSLKIENVREVWMEQDIRKFVKEASSLVSPFSKNDFPMKIRVKAKRYGIDEFANKSIEDINLATLSFNISFNLENQTQQFAEFNEGTGLIELKEIPIKSFGGISMRLFYFDDAARRKYRKEFLYSEIDGIKIYRDGVITTPFAETQEDNDKKRDILGIDKRIWRDLFNRVSSREIIGFVDISKENNPEIIDATNRQDFVDNVAYRDLKEFIILQLDAIEKFKIFKRNEKKKSSHSSLQSATEDLDSIISSVENITRENPALKNSLKPVIAQAKKTGKTVKDALREKENAEKEFERKENIYMSIMSLQEYAIHITHAVRTTLNKIKDKVRFFELFYPDPSEEEYFLLYAKEMSKEFQVLNKVIDYMLSYSQSNIIPEEVNITNLISEVVAEYTGRLKGSGTTIDLRLEDNIVLQNTNKIFFRDIFQNLMDNSIKAILNSKEKIIRISLLAERNNLIINFSDTGCGIPLEKRSWVFGLYNTTTENLGGAGIGLYIVKTRTESLKGTVFVNDSEFGEIGTTITINLPFKR